MRNVDLFSGFIGAFFAATMVALIIVSYFSVVKLLTVDLMSLIPPAIAVLGTLGLAMAGMLVWASKAFYVETNPLVDAPMELMPGANCGACGCLGCADFAEHVVARYYA